MDISGFVVKITDAVQITEKLKKRELVVEYAENPQYPEYIKLEAVNDKCAALDSVQVGDEVQVYFNLRGRQYTDKTGAEKYFNSLSLWKLNVITKAEDEGPETAQFDPSNPPSDDDLPF